MKKLVLPLTIALFCLNVGFANHLVHQEYKADYRKAITPGYYLGFSTLHDKLREVRLPEDISKTNSFFNSLFLDFHLFQ